MRRYRVEFTMDSVSICIYIDAKLVLKTSEQQIIADGVKIDLPGPIVELRSD